MRPARFNLRITIPERVQEEALTSKEARARAKPEERSMFDVRAVFGKDRVNDIAELAGDRAKTCAMVLAFGTLALVEGTEVGIEADSDV